MTSLDRTFSLISMTSKAFLERMVGIRLSESGGKAGKRKLSSESSHKNCPWEGEGGGERWLEAREGIVRG